MAEKLFNESICATPATKIAESGQRVRDRKPIAWWVLKRSI